MKRPNRFDYDDCMSTLERHAGTLTDNESVSLNIIAGAWAAGERVTSDEIFTAQDIVARMARRKPTPTGPAHTI
jgi:hypothetical protein